MSDVDDHLRDEFLDQLVDRAERLGADCSRLPDQIRHRLAIGEERYGSGAFRSPDRDNLRELSEEAQDLICYALFEYLTTVEATDDTEGHIPQDLFMAALYAAVADSYARRARVTV